MPYSSVDQVPSRIKGKKKRKQWMAVWNSIYAETHDEGRAFAGANSVTSKVLADRLMVKAADEVYEDTGEYDLPQEAHLREELITYADYAEEGPTYDPAGKYLCKTCDMRKDPDQCMRVEGPISFDTGGCRIYIHGEEPETAPEMPQKLSQTEAAYTERPNVKSFGCWQCEYGGEAKEKDDDGRGSWCKFWGLHVIPTACCFKNTGSDDVFAPADKAKAEKLVRITVQKCGSVESVTVEKVV